MNKAGSRWSPVFLLAILLLGFFLRIHDLGRNGLRLDEAGQALAAIQPTVAGMIAIEKTHAAAMPLDYLGTRLASTIGTHEFILRYPSAIWATLSIALLYLLARRLNVSRGASLLAAFFLALSPSHVYYAQELRFYASLQALALLSTVVLVGALQRPSWRVWALFAVVTALGAYFHPYVLLTIVFGAIYLVLDSIQRGAIQREAWFGLVAATAFIGLTFLPGFFIFGSSGATVTDPLQWTGSLQRFLLGGLDWTNKVNTAPSVTSTAWAWFNLSLMVMGLYAVLRERRRYLMLISLLIGVVVITLIIILTTLLSNYWLLSRQIIHLSPVLMIIAAVGVDWLVGLAHRPPASRSPNTLQTGVIVAVIVLTGFAAAQKLGNFYNGPRNSGREVALALIATHQGREPIFVVPPHETQSFQFYMTAAGRASLGEQMMPTTFDQLTERMTADTGRTHVALAFKPDESQLAILHSLGLERVVPAADDSPNSYQLFSRPLRHDRALPTPNQPDLGCNSAELTRFTADNTPNG